MEPENRGLLLTEFWLGYRIHFPEAHFRLIDLFGWFERQGESCAPLAENLRPVIQSQWPQLASEIQWAHGVLGRQGIAMPKLPDNGQEYDRWRHVAKEQQPLNAHRQHPGYGALVLAYQLGTFHASVSELCQHLRLHMDFSVNIDSRLQDLQGRIEWGSLAWGAGGFMVGPSGIDPALFEAVVEIQPLMKQYAESWSIEGVKADLPGAMAKSVAMYNTISTYLNALRAS